MKAARWGKGLTCPVKYGIINSVTYGEMSERFKELVLKTSDSERGRGFESHSLRQQLFVFMIFILPLILEMYPSW